MIVIYGQNENVRKKGFYYTRQKCKKCILQSSGIADDISLALQWCHAGAHIVMLCHHCSCPFDIQSMP